MINPSILNPSWSITSHPIVNQYTPSCTEQDHTKTSGPRVPPRCDSTPHTEGKHSWQNQLLSRNPVWSRNPLEVLSTSVIRRNCYSFPAHSQWIDYFWTLGKSIQTADRWPWQRRGNINAIYVSVCACSVFGNSLAQRPEWKRAEYSLSNVTIVFCNKQPQNISSIQHSAFISHVAGGGPANLS